MFGGIDAATNLSIMFHQQMMDDLRMARYARDEAYDRMKNVVAKLREALQKNSWSTHAAQTMVNAIVGLAPDYSITLSHDYVTEYKRTNGMEISVTYNPDGWFKMSHMQSSKYRAYDLENMLHNLRQRPDYCPSQPPLGINFQI